MTHRCNTGLPLTDQMNFLLQKGSTTTYVHNMYIFCPCCCHYERSAKRGASSSVV